MHWPTSPSDSNGCCCLTLSTHPRSAPRLPPLLSPISLRPPSPEGLLPRLHTGSSLVHSRHTHAHTQKNICFCSSPPALLLPVPPFPAWEQGLAGKRGAESPGMCIPLSCSLLLEVEGKARGARRGRLPPKGRADIYKRAGALPLDLFLALLPRKSCQ